MRITKEPEVRKQEILDTALKLFGENGYEKTSITDIAKAIGVAQGLCYRYFPSKEALFDSAIEQYADVLVEQFVGSEKDSQKTLRQIIEDMPATMEQKDTKYYSVFHGAENKKFHDQLSLKVCEKLTPLVEKLLLRARQKGEIQFDDIQAAAMFCVANVNSKCEKNIKKYNQASRANFSRHSANTISEVFQPNISRG